MSIDKKKIGNLIKIAVIGTGTAFIGLNIIAKKKKGDSVFEKEIEQKNPLEGKKVIFVEDENDEENADGVRGHLEAVGETKKSKGIYDRYVKRAIDIVLSFGGLVLCLLFMQQSQLRLKLMIQDRYFLHRRELVRIRNSSRYISFAV